MGKMTIRNHTWQVEVGKMLRLATKSSELPENGLFVLKVLLQSTRGGEADLTSGSFVGATVTVYSTPCSRSTPLCAVPTLQSCCCFVLCSFLLLFSWATQTTSKELCVIYQMRHPGGGWMPPKKLSFFVYFAIFSGLGNVLKRSRSS